MQRLFGSTLGVITDVNTVKRQVATVGNGVMIELSGIVGAGHGLYATRDFEPDEIVTYYDGALGGRIRVTDLDPLYKTHARRLNGYYTVYGNFTPSGEKIELANGRRDQVLGSGGGAFINAKVPSETNCEWYVVRSDSNRARFDETEDPFQIAVLVRATKRINAGEELFIDYGTDYWRNDDDRGDAHMKPVFITHTQYEQSISTPKRGVHKRITPQLI